ncbi:MAG: methyltransferase domain-containing protein [Nanoarchaeota archaeon]
MTNTISQQQVWNKIASKWQSFRERAPEEVVEFLEHQKGKVLDMGCGGGRNFIKNANIIYYGVDFSEKMLGFAEAKAKKIGVRAILLEDSLDRLHFSDNFFDAAIFISTLQCIETSEKRLKALKELHRVLKKGGEAMITVWDKSHHERISKIKEKESYIIWKLFGDKYKRYYYFYKKSELINLLEEVGFKIVKRKIKKRGSHSKRNIILYIRK